MQGDLFNTSSMTLSQLVPSASLRSGGIPPKPPKPPMLPPPPGALQSSPLETLFLALSPDMPSARFIEGYGRGFLRDHGLRYNRAAHAWWPPERNRLHASLLGLGLNQDWPEDRLSEMDLVLQSLVLPPVKMTLNHILSFGRRRGNCPLVLTGDDDDVQHLRWRLLDALRPLGLRDRKAFKPHITLAWGPGVISEQWIEPIELVFNDFVLIQSTRNRHVHRLRGRWLLGDRSSPRTGGR